MRIRIARLLGIVALIALHSSVSAAAFHNPYGKLPANATPGDRMLAAYFEAETKVLSERCLAGVRSLEDWKAQRSGLRRQLFEMLGLDPLPPKTDLKAEITGKLDHPEFTVEKLVFQSSPGLYITGDLYIPKGLSAPAPTILYVCGHSPAKTNGVSYGCKVIYQGHGAWFARNGYVCLVLDTVELGEIEGRHHGTYRDGMWWWNSRGYSSAAAEAWNCIRALDYLETRPEVDKTRFGVTGRSGGGAYSWWISALDERIKAACPVAGITDLQNHVVDGTVEGHCDCMFMVNTYRWDFAQVAALVAPRPLLICNSDKDTIFPLDGVNRLHEKVRSIYDLYGASDKLGLLITEGPHRDTQDLQVPVFRWFNRFLKGDESPIQLTPTKLFTGQELKVLDHKPADEITSHCYENFTQLAGDNHPVEIDRVMAELRQKTFGGWPSAEGPLKIREIASKDRDNMRFAAYEFESQPGINLRFYLVRPIDVTPRLLDFETLDEFGWANPDVLLDAFSVLLPDEMGQASVPNSVDGEYAVVLRQWLRLLQKNRVASILFAPRGIGPSAITNEKPYSTHVRRRFMLLGQTLAGMQVWDVRRAVEAARQLDGLREIPVDFYARSEMAEVATFAALFGPTPRHLRLARAPRTDQAAPDFLNWARIITAKQLLKLADGQCAVTVGSLVREYH